MGRHTYLGGETIVNSLYINYQFDALIIIYS